MGDEVVPLSTAAVAAFSELRDLASGCEWVVASPHRKSSSRGHLGETALNKTVYWLLKKGRLNMPRWTPHDMRRTSRSHWSEKLGIPWDLCERLLGHALPTRGGYAGLPPLPAASVRCGRGPGASLRRVDGCRRGSA